jgi:hypothetical protein
MSTCSDQMRAASEYILLYLSAILEDGDYLNGWLSRVPECGAGALQGLGMILATLLGYPA